MGKEKRETPMDYQKISPEEIKQALDFSAAQIKRYLPQFTDKFQKDRKSTRLNSSHSGESRMPSSA